MADWRLLFDPETFAEGIRMQAEGKAKRANMNETGYDVRVRGDRNYDVEIFDFGFGIEDIVCTCDEALEGYFCAHMAAALLLVESIYGITLELEESYAEEIFSSAEAKMPAPDSGADMGAAAAGQKGGHSGADIGAVAAGQESGHNGADIGAAEAARMKASGVDGGTAALAARANGSGADGRIISIAALRDLKNKEDAARLEQLREEGQDTFEPGEYRYFQVDDFRRELGISKKDEQAARNVLASEPHRVNIRIGHYQPETYREMVMMGDGESGLNGLLTLEEEKQKWSVRMRFGRSRILFSECYSWGCRYERLAGSPVGHKLCVHEVAALLLLEKYLRENNPGDATSARAYELMDPYTDAARGEQDAAAGAGERLRLEPYVRIDDDGNWYVQFRVGAKRLYKIKELAAFPEKVRRHETEPFGAKTELLLGREYLDDTGRGWLDFIEESMRVFRGFMEHEDDDEVFFYRRGEGWVRITDRYPLFGEVLDRFFSRMGDSRVEFEDYRGRSKKSKKISVIAAEEELKPTLSIEPFYEEDSDIYEGIRVSGHVPPLKYGSRAGYYLEDGRLCCISGEEMEALEPLVHAANRAGRIDVRIGRGNLAAFYRNVLPKLRETVKIREHKPEITQRYLPPEPSFVCYLDVDEESVLCRPEVFYGAVSHTVLDVLEWQAYRRNPEIYRDGEAEARVLSLLQGYLPEIDFENGVLLAERSEAGLFAFLEHGLTELMELSEVRATERFLRLRVRNRMNLNVGVSLASGVMNLDLTSSDLTPDELLDVLDGYRRKLRYIRLKNGDFLQIEDSEEVARLAELMATLRMTPKEFVSGKMHIPAYRALYLDKMLELMGDVYAERDSHFRKLIKEFKTVSDADYETPAALKNTLRNYQTVGYRWLRTLDEYGFGGILADDMGLGKTLQVIAVLLADHNEIDGNGVVQDADAAHGSAAGEKAASTAAAGADAAWGDMAGGKHGTWTSLVVCPASLVYNWKEELRRYAPQLRTALIVGSVDTRKTRIAAWREYDVLVTSYDLLKRDIAEYEGKKFRFEIVDEAQYIKNHTTAAAKSVKLIQSCTRYALTGTPIENRLSELWSIFDYLMPGFLYEYRTFRDELETPIVKEKDDAAMERLRRMVTPFILRRSKKEVLKDLPDKLEEIRYAGFEEAGEQQRLYDAQVVRMREDLRSQTDEEFKSNRIEILAELTRIRQICCDPALIYESYSGGSAKREACMELVQSSIEGEHKALIFSQFKSMLALLEEDLRAEGIPYYKIVGDTPKEERVELVKRFNRDDTPVFLISLKAGGTGLNLTGADVVIHYDPWWNLAVQNQASDRAHRIGQTRVVTVYKLIVKNTIEERILEMQESKRALAEDILSAEAVGSSRFDREELLELLT